MMTNVDLILYPCELSSVGRDIAFYMQAGVRTPDTPFLHN